MSLLEVNKITPQSGTTLVLGDSGDTINFGSGVLPNFENLTVTGDLTVDTNSLKVDSANNYVGIGTASPSSALDIVGNIVVSGTVDGRDIATDGTKLDTIATNATANPNAIDNVVEYTTPQLGGNLDLNSNNITGTGNINITGTVAATSYTGDGSSLTGINTDLVSDTTPQLGGDLASNGHDILMADNDKINVGTSNDLQIYHDGTHSYIVDSGTGNLYVQSSDRIQFYNSTGTEVMANFDSNGACRLFYDNSLKIATTATGVDVTGTITFDGGTTTADLNFGDSDKAVFGAGSDLQIYHTGVDSFIRDAGTGNLRIQATNFKLENAGATQSMIEGYDGGAVDLRYAGATRLYTTTGGVFITGGIEMTANLDMGDNDKILLGSSDDLEIYHDGSNSVIKDNGTGFLSIQSNGSLIGLSSTTGENYALFRNNGAVELYYDNSKKLETTAAGATVTGNLDVGAELNFTTTGVENILDFASTDMRLRFLNSTPGFETILKAQQNGVVELYYDGSKKIETTSAGVFVTGNISTADNGKFISGTSADLQIYHDGSNSYINETGTGNLLIRASSAIRLQRHDGTENFLTANQDGACELYYNGTKRLETTSTGANVTGSLTVNGSALGTETAFAYVNFNGTGTVSIRGSYNVSSITDNQTGDYSVNFSSSASNSTYTAVGTGGDPGQDGEPFWTQAISTSAWRGWLKVPNAGRNDRPYVMATIHGG